MRDLIATALMDSSLLLGLSDKEWDLLIRQGRRANLLARLAYQVTEKGLIDQIPHQPRLHLVSALRMVERQNQAMRWEVQCLLRGLENIGVEIVLLKGAAYVMADLPTANGRAFSDIDILVPKHAISQVESQLMLNGWQGTHHDDYDQRYYRQWMHEIPPMRHVTRGTNIDVHHTILPESARFKVNTPALFEGIIPLPGYAGLYVLSPVDMLLHSATHLFHEGELENGLRDLFDLDSLFRNFGQTSGFWHRLVPRAMELGLIRPLHYSIRFCTMILHTPIPEEVINVVNAEKPPMWASMVMDYCYARALRPTHESCNVSGTSLARFMLYVRSHWIRMPFHLLLFHLTRKALRRSTTRSWDAPFARDAT